MIGQNLQPWYKRYYVMYVSNYSDIQSNNIINHCKIFQLVSMDWKLGVAMSSSSCRSLSSPYVTLQLRIAEAGGNIRLQTVEMTIPEFQVCSLLRTYLFDLMLLGFD